MYLLDTNLISETLRPHPDARVVQWLDAQAPHTLYLCSVVRAELMMGAEMLPKGKRRTQLLNALLQLVLPPFAGRVLAFDEACADAMARLHAQASARGAAQNFPDTAIAATAVVHGLTVATRNTDDFDALGVVCINPWLAPVR